jgi:hypothetical protein
VLLVILAGAARASDNQQGGSPREVSSVSSRSSPAAEQIVDEKAAVQATGDASATSPAGDSRTEVGLGEFALRSTLAVCCFVGVGLLLKSLLARLRPAEQR